MSGAVNGEVTVGAGAERAADGTAAAGVVPALYDIVAGSGCDAVAIIGLVKNAGKTTVVNALLSQGEGRFGLTSLGLDGERTDQLTGLAKPSIAPPQGSLVATTRGSLERSRYALDELEELPFLTPLGRVVIGRAAAGGNVEVSGPTTLAEVRRTIERLQAHGAAQVLVDGAIDRIGSASPRVCDGVVVATGGMVGDTLDETLATTVAALDMLALPEVSAQTRALVAPYVAQGARAVLFDAAGEATPLELTTVLGEGAGIARRIERLRGRTLYIGGALTQEFVDDLARVLPPRHELLLVVRDATVLVLPAASVARLRRRGITTEVLTPLRVLAVTANPFRTPQPYQARIFFDAVAGAVGDRAPVFDVKHGFSRLPAAPAASTVPASTAPCTPADPLSGAPAPDPASPPRKRVTK